MTSLANSCAYSWLTNPTPSLNRRINGHAAAHVEQVAGIFIWKILHRRGRLPSSRFDSLDVSQLRNDVKVKQPNISVPSGFFKRLITSELGRRQAKLCRFAARFFPAARTLRIQLYAHANHRHVASWLSAMRRI